MSARITKLRHDLGRFVDAYAASKQIVDEAGAPLRSPMGVGITTVMIGADEYGVRVRPTNPPTSREPSSSDQALRIALILSVRNIADAIRSLVPLFEDATAWEPRGLAHTYLLVKEPRTELVRCKVNGQVDWKAADDPTTPLLSPGEVSVGVRQLKGLLGALENQWEDVDEADREVVEDALAYTDIAIDTLRYRGMWSQPVQPQAPPSCEEEGCDTVPEWGRNTFRRRCSKHRRDGRAA